MSSAGMIERVGRAIAEEDGADFDSYPLMYRALARAAIEAMREPTIEMQLLGAEAIALRNIEFDGPAIPPEDCKTPDDWMERGANIAGRMVSGAESTACWTAMIDAALSTTHNPEEM